MAIRFLKPWYGRQVGHIDVSLTPGVAATLVQRRVAEYVTAAGVGESVTSRLSQVKRPRGRRIGHA